MRSLTLHFRPYANRDDPAMIARPVHRKMVAFAIVGVLNSGVDALSFLVFLGVGAAPLLANLLAWICGVSFSYQVNSRWTFQRSADRPYRWLRFVATGAAASLLSSTLILWALSGALGVWPAKLLAIVVGAGLGFLGARWSIEGRARG